MEKLEVYSVFKVETIEKLNVIESVEQVVKGTANEERHDAKLNDITSGINKTIKGDSPVNALLRINLNGKPKSVVKVDNKREFSYLIVNYNQRIRLRLKFVKVEYIFILLN